MKKYIKHLFAGFLLIGFTMPALAQSADEIFRAVGSPENPKVEISFNRYYTAEGHATLTKKIADAYPNLVRRISIGKSYEGRDMWMLQITNFQKGEANRKPGFYIDGNIHSNEIQGF
jgi:murein tripeptide amidase MpaA